MMAMDHEVVARQKITEKYLLNELDSETRDQFEEHFFDCSACAFDVRAGSAFVEQSKVVLAEGHAEAPVAAPVPAKSGWRAWLRPAFAMPALAVLLAVVGYQNLVTYPRMKQAVDHPQVLPWASVNIGTLGATGPEITTAPGKGFLVFVRIPPQSGYSLYTANLYNPAGKLEWSLTIPATATQDQWPISVPGADRQGGTYTLVVRGSTTAGDSKDVGQGSFELQIQK
jgi:hypothetical protein